MPSYCGFLYYAAKLELSRRSDKARKDTFTFYRLKHAFLAI